MLSWNTLRSPRHSVHTHNNMSAFVIVKSHLAALDTVAFNSFLSLSLSKRLDAV
jgi:hypothetical protein